MTSTDSSTSNNNTTQTQAQSDTTNTASNNPGSSPIESTKAIATNDSNELNSSAVSSSSASPASSQSPTSTNTDTSTDKTQTLETTTEQTESAHNTSQKEDDSTESSCPSQSQQPAQQFVNYYPAYVPQANRQQNNSGNGSNNYQAEWTQSMDPMQLAAYMNNNPTQTGGNLPYQQPLNQNEFTQQQYDQFSFGFTPAFGFGYNGNGSVDYAALQAAQQTTSNLNPQSNQWMPSTNLSTTPTPSSVVATSGTTTTGNNPSSSPANTTSSSNDTTSSVPSSAANSDSSASNSKWMQVIQDPLAVHEFNHTSFQPAHPQQLSPGDIYAQQQHYPTQNNNYRSHHHYQRHQQQQPQHLQQQNYHHYQYNNNHLYQMPHYGSQYVQQQHQPQHHHYNQNKYNKYNNNNGGGGYNNGYGNNGFSHDSNNNSRKSSNLNNVNESIGNKKELEVERDGEEQQYTTEEEKLGQESVGESNGSKSWASIVGVPNMSNALTKNTSASTKQQTSQGSTSPLQTESSNETTNTLPVETQIKNNNSHQPMNYQSNNFSSEYPTNNNNYNNSKPRHHQNNYSKFNKNESTTTTAQQVFDVTSLSFPPIGADIASIKAELSECSKQQTVDNNNKKAIIDVDSNNYSANPAANGQHFYPASKKQQQYNNYQRQQQQQFNLPIGKYQNDQNGPPINNYQFNPKSQYYSNGDSGTEPQQAYLQQRSERGDRIDRGFNNDTRSGDKRDQQFPKPDFYNRRHQPAQHTLSSFLNIIDKTKFNDKSNKDNKSLPKTDQTKNNSALDNNEVSGHQVEVETNEKNNGVDVEELSQQAGEMHLESSINQLVVYTNPGAYNPKEFNTSPKAARFFVIKSYSEDDIHRSIKYNIWCSTEHGNRRLDSAYFKGDGQVPVYLFFSVNGSGHFCGMAEMHSRVDYNRITGVWSQDKWRGCFQVKWIYVKDVPNSLLRNIKLENNDNKPVTNSRDTQEIPYDKGRQVLKVFHTYSHSSSILDDFEHYERKQEEGKAILKAPHNNYEESSTGMTFVDTNYQQIQQEMINNNTNPQQSTTNDINEQDQTTKQPENLTNKPADVSVTSSPTASSSSSSTSSIDEAKQQEKQILDQQPQQQSAPQLISSSS